MEKIEKRRSVHTDQKGSEFFTINSLGELLPIILITFFLAFVASYQRFEVSTVSEQLKPALESNEAAFVEEQTILKKKELNQEDVHLNSSPSKKSAKMLPVIESIQKRQAAPEKAFPELKETVARPHFPKAKARKPLPTLEVSNPIKKAIPQTEKLTVLKVEELEKIVVEPKLEEEFIVLNYTPTRQTEVIQPVKALGAKTIGRLANIAVDKPEMELNPNWTPVTTTVEEIIVEKEQEIVQAVPEEVQIKTSLNVTDYNSSDFKWAVNNYNHGIKKSAKFTNTPDGKASYCRTDAGIVLKINDLSDIDASYGIFVEKSEDGTDYNSIGIINAENTNELFYFDPEHSIDGQHHYRFRSTNKVGENFEFGKVSVIRRASIAPISSKVNTAGSYSLVLESKSVQAVKFEIEEAWGSLNTEKGTKNLTTGENKLSFDLAGDPGLYFLTISTANQVLELLVEKPGLSPDLSFYEQEVSGKQNFTTQKSPPFFINKPKKLNFDFYLKNGNTLIFNAGEYKSETVKIKKAKIGTLPNTLQARHSDETLWFMASSNISYLHQKVPVILEHNNQEIAAQINIFSSKNTIRPISHFSPDGDGIQDNWRIPGIESCPNTDLLVFNDWGNLIYKTNNVTDKNIWKGQKNGQDLPAGMYYYVLGQYGGWVQLER